MVISAFGRRMIEIYEGYEANAYQDQRGIWTIGYGHTQGVKQGDFCTKDQADAYLDFDLVTTEHAVNQVFSNVVLTQNQFDACVSLAYNIGAGAFKHSTLVKLFLEGDVVGASNQFLVWCKTKGVTNEGLLSRRKTERALFNTVMI